MSAGPGYECTRACVFDYDSDEAVKLKANELGIGRIVLTEWGLTVFDDRETVQTFYPMRLVMWTESPTLQYERPTSRGPG